MRKYTEPTCRHLLRQPLIFGIPVAGVIVLSTATVGGQVLAHGNSTLSLVGLGFAFLSYGALRALTRFSKPGWDQNFLFALERLSAGKLALEGGFVEGESDFEIISPDTLNDQDLLSSKQLLEDTIKHLKPDETLTLICRVDSEGARLTQITSVSPCEKIKTKAEIAQCLKRIYREENQERHVYSMHQIPMSTDPLWIFSQFKDFNHDYEIIISIRGVEQTTIKQKIEAFRRLNSQTRGGGEIDSNVSFEDASQVLRGLSRGDDCVVEVSFIVVSTKPIDLDSHYFYLEKAHALPLLSVLGLRVRFHRSHLIRAVNATDLVPHIGDPFEKGTAIFQTVRDKPLYFDPQDSKLDALHWLVCGATGTGKSFAVGLILKRMVDANRNIGVLFIDHKRSFRRLVTTTNAEKLGQPSKYYLEPQSFSELKANTSEFFQLLDKPGMITGIELSDMPAREKREAASYLLKAVAEFLGKRTSSHVLYIVMDECWKFLKDDPRGVEEAFREFRKFDAAVIAITQSLNDFVSNEVGQSIIQNAEITLLLRQKEDVTKFKDVLDLNETEMSKVKQIKKKKGVFAECLIKTPFISRFGRICPTDFEHETLRTDNLRHDRIRSRPGSAEEA